VKKLLFLLVAVLLVSSIFAAGSVREGGIFGLVQTSPTIKVETQVRILTAMNRLKITTSQASALAKSMMELKKDVNSLQQEQLKALTSLRDALLSSNKEAIANAQKRLKDISKSYLEALKKFEDSVESVVTLKQALLIDQRMKSIMEKQGSLQDFLKNFVGKSLNIFRRQVLLRPPVQRKNQMDKSGKKDVVGPARKALLIQEISKREDVLSSKTSIFNLDVPNERRKLLGSGCPSKRRSAIAKKTTASDGLLIALGASSSRS